MHDQAVVNGVQSLQKGYLYNAFLVVIGSLVLAVSAQLFIPWQPVPLTFQTPTVLLLGILYGPRLGAATVGLYLLEGVCGLPVFAEMSFGPAVLFGPTGGYLLSYLVGAFASGYLMERGFNRNLGAVILAVLIGTLLIFIGGVAQLSCFVGLQKAFEFGVMPFILTEPVKLLVGSVAVYYLWRK